MLAVYIMLFYYKNDQKTIFLRQESKFINSADQSIELIIKIIAKLGT